GDARGKKSLHFFGAAKSGKLDGWVDVRVELSQPEKDSFHLSMDRELADATELVDTGGEGQVTVVLRSENELASAVMDLALLQAFANDPRASSKMAAKRSVLSGSVLPPRCGTKSLSQEKGLTRMAAPTTWADYKPEALGAELGDVTRIDAGRGIK